MLTEAEATGEVIKTDNAKQFVRQLGHHIKSIEHHIDVMREPKTAPSEVRPAPQPPAGDGPAPPSPKSDEKAATVG